MFQKEFNQRVNIRQVLSLSSKDGRYPYPIDLNIKRAVNIELPYLLWYNYGTKPQNMKITNIGTSVVLSSRWEQDRPFLKSGPLPENYIFSQLHFHWGDDDGQGSQHTAEGRCFPMEMHVVHYKASYVHPRAAHNKPDGMVVVVYLFQIQGSDNESIDHLVNALPYVKEPFSSVEITPTTIEEYVVPFDKNYFLYWGSLKFQACDHKIMWLICREPIGVSRRQMCNFRKLNGPDHQPMSHMFFGVQSLFNRTLFLINGAPPLDRTLLPILSIGRVGIPTTINQETGVVSEILDSFNVIDTDLVKVIPPVHSDKDIREKATMLKTGPISLSI